MPWRQTASPGREPLLRTAAARPALSEDQAYRACGQACGRLLRFGVAGWSCSRRSCCSSDWSFGWSHPRPALFLQERLGQDGAPFTFYKFRTMVDGNDPTIHQTYVRATHHCRVRRPPKAIPVRSRSSNDPRVTRFGRILRRTSIDELPQLLNVLAGDMSLVGPRPPLALRSRAVLGSRSASPRMQSPALPVFGR